jgi:hypothetical protein
MTLSCMCKNQMVRPLLYRYDSKHINNPNSWLHEFLHLAYQKKTLEQHRGIFPWW